MIDTLTQIPNLENLTSLLGEAKSPKLFIIDIKDFKELNLRHGDNAGNFILISFASALEKFAQTHKMAHFRIGSDEFALFKDEPFDLSLMEKILININDFIASQEYKYEKEILKIDAHMGISFDHFKPLQKALSALELAKKQNNAFMTHSEFATNLLQESNEDIFKSIKNAIKEKKILPFYQPIVDAKNRTLYEEVLMRIEGENGVQSPKFFLDIAYQRGIYPQIMREIFSHLEKIKKPKGINLSYHDFEDEELFLHLLETFEDSDTIFELQSDDYLQEPKSLAKIKKIKEHNIAICIDNVKSIDDFSTFKKGEIDFVKIDGDLIRLLGLLGIEYLTCKEILEACSNLGIKAIASRINSTESFEASKAIGFKYFQGFLLAEPSR